MTKEEEIMEKLTEYHIKDILTELNVPFKDMGHYIQCQSVCHGGDNFNLAYLKSKKFFNCFSEECGGMSPSFLIRKITGKPKGQVLQYLGNKVGVNLTVFKPRAFNSTTSKIQDWNFLDLYNQQTETMFKEEELPKFDKRLLRCFDKIYPLDWIEEHIEVEAMEKYNIMFHSINNDIVIPHYDRKNRLVGIRARHLNSNSVAKYTPIKVNGVMCNHKLRYNLYGLNHNEERIKKLRKVIIVESEKAVMQLESYLGDYNVGVAICGSSISDYQKNFIMSLGVDEVIIAIDKDYINAVEGDSEYEKYCLKLNKDVMKFKNFINTTVLKCDDDRLGYKESPTDRGKDIFLQLLSERQPFVYEDRYGY